MVAVEEFKVTLPLPHSALSPNARPHHFALSNAKAAAKQGAFLRARAALPLGGKPPRWEAAEAEAVFYHAQKRGRDGDNALASLKAAYDGIAMAGIVANDKGIRHLPVRFEIDPANPRVEVTLRPL